jgi:hypothetical protein
MMDMFSTLDELKEYKETDYRKRIRQKYRCYRFPFCFLINICQDIRASKMKKKAENLFDWNKLSEDEKGGAKQPKQIQKTIWTMFQNTKHNIVELLDCLSDFNLLYLVYNNDRTWINNHDDKPKLSYKVACTIIFMSISSGYLIQYSSTLNQMWN